MTMAEAVRAARMNVPVIHEDPMEGPILYARIKSIRKDFALKSDVARGAEAESYALELLPMNRARSVTSAALERVREATSQEIADLTHYKQGMKMPEVHPELLCEEVKSGRPWAEDSRKAGTSEIRAAREVSADRKEG